MQRGSIVMVELKTGLKRATRDRWFMGVCGGIAREFGWNAKAVRFGAVFLALALPGPGTLLVPLAYIILGALLPKSEEF
jgi:phage shock protein PspC (stress-responsive transcriptional regulator)